jgi:hypothetical protein
LNEGHEFLLLVTAILCSQLWLSIAAARNFPSCTPFAGYTQMPLALSLLPLMKLITAFSSHECYQDYQHRRRGQAEEPEHEFLGKILRGDANLMHGNNPARVVSEWLSNGLQRYFIAMQSDCSALPFRQKMITPVLSSQPFRLRGYSSSAPVSFTVPFV